MADESEDEMNEARQVLDRRSSDALANAIEHMAKALTDQVQETKRSNEVATALVKATSDRSVQLDGFAAEQARWNRQTQRRAAIRDVLILVLIACVLWVGSLNRITNTTVLDCVQESTDPQSCYQKQQRSAGEIVASIIDVDKDGKPDSVEQESLLEQIIAVLDARANP